MTRREQHRKCVKKGDIHSEFPNFFQGTDYPYVDDCRKVFDREGHELCGGREGKKGGAREGDAMPLSEVRKIDDDGRQIRWATMRCNFSLSDRENETSEWAENCARQQ